MFKIKMQDTNIRKLIERCKEKEKQGYDYLTKIKKQSSTGLFYSQGYGGQFSSDGLQSSDTYAVMMFKS